MSKKFYNTPEIQLTECVMMKFAVCSGGDNSSGSGVMNDQGLGGGNSGGLGQGAPGRVF